MRVVLAVLLLSVSCWEAVEAAPAKTGLEFIRVSNDGRHFVHSASKEFKLWGFNYDHDTGNRLLEDYWEQEWSAVVQHFRDMKALGANAVRIHLQVAKFMKSPREPNARSLKQLSRLLLLTEKTGLYLDITDLEKGRRAAVV